ncbi:hypothetical protein [Ramlibacter montanisoli]|uniref:Uncharacterized protein n=1 Tax=Ramlibacter montanisoli TaxID=2732512 RepID=A0A849KMB6_9BURK|nr:hypothetical protein [Ramlibacter montanisoli]NNU42919.1 hypothetical protein [Ramlibacter montanisoli]
MKSLLKSIPRHARWIGVAALLAVAPREPVTRRPSLQRSRPWRAASPPN